MSKSRIVLISILVVIGLITFFGGVLRENDGHSKNIGETFSGELKIVVSNDYPPFGYKNPAGRTKGYDLDYARLICDRFEDVLCDISFKPFVEVMPAIINGEFDIAVSSFTITDERKELVDFSIPYYYSYGQFVHNKNVSPADVGNRVAVQAGTIYERILSENDDYEVISYQSIGETFDAVALREVDLTIADDVIADLYIRAPKIASFDEYGGYFLPFGKKLKPNSGFPNIELVGKGEIAIVINKDKSDMLLKPINRAIKEVSGSSELKDLNLHYFGRDISKK